MEEKCNQFAENWQSFLAGVNNLSVILTSMLIWAALFFGISLQHCLPSPTIHPLSDVTVLVHSPRAAWEKFRNLLFTSLDLGQVIKVTCEWVRANCVCVLAEVVVWWGERKITQERGGGRGGNGEWDIRSLLVPSSPHSFRTLHSPTPQGSTLFKDAGCTALLSGTLCQSNACSGFWRGEGMKLWGISIADVPWKTVNKELFTARVISRERKLCGEVNVEAKICWSWFKV